MAMVLQQTRLRLTQAIFFGKPATGVIPGGPFVRTNGTTPLTGNWNAGKFFIDSKNSSREINVAEYASGGDGTGGNPWTGWDTLTPWAVNTTFRFPKGQYNYATAPSVNFQGIRLVGEGPGTFLNFIGAGNAFVLDGGAVGTLFDVGMQGFVINGNAAATNGLSLRSVHHSVFRDIRVQNVSASGLLVNFGVCNVYERFRCSANESGGFTTVPVNGMVLTRRGVNEDVTASTIVEPVVEGVSGTGIILDYAVNNVMIGGTSEANNKGLQLTANGYGNTIQNLDMEVNAVEDLEIESSANIFQGVLAAAVTAVHLYTGSSKNHFYGGQINGVLIDAGAVDNDFKSCSVRIGTAAFTDNGTSTGTLDVFDVTAGAYLPNRVFNALSVFSALGVNTDPGVILETKTLVNGNSNLRLRAAATGFWWDLYAATVNSNADLVFVPNGGALGSPTLTLSASGHVGVGPGAAAASRELDLAGTQRYRGIAAPAVSEVNSATLYFDQATNHARLSENGGPYVNVLGAGGLTGTGVAQKLAYWTNPTNLTDEPNITLGGTYTLDVAGDINQSVGSGLRSGGDSVFNSTTLLGISVVTMGGNNGSVGASSTAVGHGSMAGGGGASNTALGEDSLGGGALGTAQQNTAVGISSLSVTTGDKNTALGNLAGFTNTTGSTNVFLGAEADASAGNLTNAVAIGYQAVVADNNAMQLGNAAMRVGIRTAGTPKHALDVGGAVAVRQTGLVLVNGANQDVAITDFSWFRITGPTAVFNIGGIAGGTGGQILMLRNTTAFQMTLNNADAGSIAVNRIVTPTGGNVNCSVATLVYDDTSDLWIVQSYF